MADIVKFYPADAAKDPDCVLEQAIGQYSQVLLIGLDKDGEFDAHASDGLADARDVLWLIEAFKAKLINGGFESDHDA